MMKWLYLVCVISLVLVIIIITYAGGEILPSLREIISRRPNADTGEESTAEAEPTATVDAYYFDVGAGECALYICNNAAMLVDSGEKDYSGAIVGYLEDLGVTRLDYIVATSLSSGNIGSMSTIIQKFSVGNVILPTRPSLDASNPLYLAVLSAMNAKNIQPIVIEDKNIYEFNLGQAYVDILTYGNSEKSLNQPSRTMSVHISLGSMSFLHMGDATDEELDEVMNTYPDLYASVLKMPNHGKYTDTLDRFIDFCSPSACVIGVSPYYKSLPSEQTLEKLQKSDVKCYRIDEYGSVSFSSDGNTFTIKTDK